VNDGAQDGAPDNVTVTATPPNVKPTAEAGPDQSAVTGSTILFDGSGSHDPDLDVNRRPRLTRIGTQS
jgi:hypothetical protein